jgi:uncharacterized membrane protein (UPF0136 family)
MSVAVIVVLTYGVLCIAGGIVGYVKARSKASLIAGLVSGLLLLEFAYEMLSGSRGAAIGSAVVAGLLGARFLSTWAVRRRVMPDLLMVIGALATLAAVAAVFLAAPPPARAADQPASPAPHEVLEAAGKMRQINFGEGELPRLVLDSVGRGMLTFDIPPIVKVAWGVDGKPVWLDDVKRGQWMRVRYIVKDGRLRAKRITLLPKPREQGSAKDAPKPQGASALDIPRAPDIGAAPSMGEAMGAGEPMSTPPAMEIPAAPDTNPYE